MTRPRIVQARTYGPIRRTPTPEWKDKDLVEECLRGNEQAWYAVVNKYKSLVYNVPITCGLGPLDDVFQEVWLDLYSELGNLQKPGELKGWLISAVTHKCYELMRRRALLADANRPNLDRRTEKRVLA